MSHNWFRNTDWSPAIAEQFEATLARTRSQRAQYLYLQGLALVPHRPDVALGLLQRAIDLGDEAHVGPALVQKAIALVALGRVDDGLATMEMALEQQLKVRWVRTSAPLDYAFLVAWYERRERYAAALPILDAAIGGAFADADLQAIAARALILADQGLARAALAQLPEGEGMMDERMLGTIGLAALRDRLVTIAA